VLDDTTVSIRAELVEELDPERLARIAQTMPADEAADLIGELEIADSEQVLKHIAGEAARVLRRLLRYPEDTAGGIMNPEVVALEPTARRRHRPPPLHRPRHRDRLALRRRLDPPAARVRAPAPSGDRKPVGAARPDHELGRHLGPSRRRPGRGRRPRRQVRLHGHPGGRRRGRLLGAAVDDVLDVIEEEATEDIYKMAGSSAMEEESESILHVARYRLPWLLICLAGTQLSTAVLQFAKGQVHLYEQMSVFTASIMAMAGNTSLQSATTTVRRLALDTLPRGRFLRHVSRELLVALLMGAVCGVTAASLALVFGHDPAIGFALGVAMAIAMSSASLLGAAMPLVLDLVKIDPAVASGPLVSTINDSLALTLYFIVATSLLIVLG
jgi:magnesium transporter